MNRLAGIALAALGLLVAILSIMGVVPGLTQTGIVMILGGGLIIGLSFIDKPTITEGEPMSTTSTLGNIFLFAGRGVSEPEAASAVACGHDLDRADVDGIHEPIYVSPDAGTRHEPRHRQDDGNADDERSGTGSDRGRAQGCDRGR